MIDYDISSIFKDMELYLIDSMSRNMKRHTNWEEKEEFQWDMWQAIQLESLNGYRKSNTTYVNKQTNLIKLKIEELLKQSNEHGGMQEEIKILNAIKKGFKPGRTPKGIEGSFFKVNDRKLKALINATTKDVQKSTTSMLRMANDEYRKTIFKSQVFANTGTMTVDQSIDLATKDFLSKGINCIEYSNGNRVNIASWAEMAIKTSNKRAYLQGEGSKRAEWGIHTVLVSQYGACSPICLPLQGKVYIDDVWSGGTAEEAEATGYGLLSVAIAAGLFHPNCKHTMTTYFEGITKKPSQADVAKTSENSNVIATQRYNERQIRKYKRLETGSLDETNRMKYKSKVKEWQQRNNELVKAHPDMHRSYKREGLRGVNRVDTTADEVIKAKSATIDDDNLDIPFKNKTVSNIDKTAYNKVEHKFTNGTYDVDDSHKMIAREHLLDNGVRVYLPENINKEVQSISVGQIKEALRDFPNEILKNIDEIEVVDYQNPMDSYIAKIYNKKSFVSAAVGGDRKITFFPSSNNKETEQIKSILFHESGHILDDEFQKATGTSISDSDDYQRVMNYDKKIRGGLYCTKYAENSKSVREDVADSVKLYCTENEQFKKKFPARHKFIREWVTWIKKK